MKSTGIGVRKTLNTSAYSLFSIEESIDATPRRDTQLDLYAKAIENRVEKSPQTGKDDSENQKGGLWLRESDLMHTPDVK